MRTIFTLIFLASLFSSANVGAAEKGLTVKGVRYSTYAAFTRVVFEVDEAAPYVLTRSQDGKSIMLSSYEGPLVLNSPLPTIRDSVVAGVEPWKEGGRMYVMIRLGMAAADVKDFALRDPDRIVLDIAKGAPPAVATPPTDGQIVVVLDPGHGGKDTGLLTGQVPEKTIDLEIALAIRKLLRRTERMKVILTREKDQSLSLDERAALANGAGASVFVSIHAALGAEARVYIQDLDDEAGTPSIRARPASSDFLVYESGSEQQDIVWGKQQTVHAQRSGGLGRKLARQMSGTNVAEPVQAPLAGLKAVDAPAVLIEVGVDRDRARTAEEIARGIEQHVLDAR